MKEWFILIDLKERGPFSIIELRYHPLVTPDTYVRKKGWLLWKKAKDIPELKEIFEDSEELEKKRSRTCIGQEELSLTTSMQPGHFLFWTTIAILLLLYGYLIFVKMNG